MARTPEQIEALLDRVESLLGDYDKADDEFRRGQWHDHFAEKLGPYEDKLKALNGDDFDIYKESFDEYGRDFSDLGEDEYIAALTANIDKLLDKLRGALGEDKVELESGNEGTEIVSHEDKGIEANAEGDTAEVDMTSSENAKTRYDKRSASNKEKLKGWNPQKGLLRSDEECKAAAEPEKIDDTVTVNPEKADEYQSKEEPKEGTAKTGHIKSDEECKEPHKEDGTFEVEGIPGVVEKIDDTVKTEDDELADFIKEAEKAKKGARFLKQ